MSEEKVTQEEVEAAATVASEEFGAPDNLKEELKTEVTSIAEEEAKTGAKIELPSDDEMKSRAMSSFIVSTQTLVQLFKSLSGRGKDRVLASIMDLPADGVPVKLKTDAEKQCFALGQRALSDRFLLTYYHIVDQAKAEREKNKQETEEPKGETNGK